MQICTYLHTLDYICLLKIFIGSLGWHEFNKGKVASAWSVVNGELWNDPRARDIIHADLVTDSTYKNFDLRFEWKISKAGNSGTFINVLENQKYGSTFSTGPEYQLLDNYNVDTAYSADAKRVAGAIFGVVAAKSSKPKPYGQWNQLRPGKLHFRNTPTSYFSAGLRS